MGSNGKVQTMQPPVDMSGLPVNPEAFNIQKFMLGLLPFTPVPFAGPDMLLAVGRVAGYSLLAYWTYNKMRPASYAFMGAAGVSLATSITAGMWGKK